MLAGTSRDSPRRASTASQGIRLKRNARRKATRRRMTIRPRARCARKHAEICRARKPTANSRRAKRNARSDLARTRKQQRTGNRVRFMAGMPRGSTKRRRGNLMRFTVVRLVAINPPRVSTCCTDRAIEIRSSRLMADARAHARCKFAYKIRAILFEECALLFL